MPDPQETRKALSMILKFQLDNITSKDADDISMLVTEFIQQECDYMVSDYWVEEDDGS